MKEMIAALGFLWFIAGMFRYHFGRTQLTLWESLLMYPYMIVVSLILIACHLVFGWRPKGEWI